MYAFLFFFKSIQAEIKPYHPINNSIIMNNLPKPLKKVSQLETQDRSPDGGANISL